MIIEQNGMVVGFDLGRDYSQITFCSRTASEPITIMRNGEDGEKTFLIPTPRGLFSRIERHDEDAIEILSGFFSDCFDLMKTAGSPEQMTVMVTMYEMNGVYAEAIKAALGRIGIPLSRILLQSHMESFYAYAMNQKKEFLMYHVVLLEYDRESITAWHLWLERKTKPVLARTEKCFRLYLDRKARKGRGDEEWGKFRDSLLHKYLEKMFDKIPVSSVYLVGKEFENGWMDKSLRFLCRKRHVFQGENLYTRGACYAAMEENGADRMKGVLYAGEDMIKHNLGMWMEIRGQGGYYPLVSAGVNWYMAEHTCEFLLNGEDSIVIYSRSIKGEELQHTLTLDGLPQRPRKATRLRLTVRFTAKNRCHVQAWDLGLGELYPSSQKTWEATIQLP